MSLEKHLERVKDAVNKTSKLSESQKSDSMKRIEEWVKEDRAFGLLEEELIKISVYFEDLFSELGIK